MKPILAAALGGLVVFVWGAIAHMMLPLGHAGMSPLPNDQAITSVLRQQIAGDGFYYFPAPDTSIADETAREQAHEAAMKTGPYGLLLYHPHGGEMMTTGQLLTELATNVLAALLLTIVLMRARAGLLGGAAIGLLFGLFTWLSLSASYWNWYGYPDDYFVAQGVIEGVGWFLGGGVCGAVLGSGASRG
jgi:hypothetical protein